MPRLLTAAFFAGGCAGRAVLVARFMPRFRPGLAGRAALAAFLLREARLLAFGGEDAGAAAFSAAVFLPLPAAAARFPCAGDLGLAGGAGTAPFLLDLVAFAALGDDIITTGPGAGAACPLAAEFFAGEVFLALLRLRATGAGLGGETAAFPLVGFLPKAAGLVVATG